jgi:hypothetical protein
MATFFSTTKEKPKAKPVKTAPASVLVATSRERLHLNRFGTGFRQDALKKLRATGGTEAWLAAQLTPESVPEASKIATIDGWFPDLRLSPAQKVATNAGGGKKAWHYGHDLGNWSILRRIYSERTVLETMVEFWTTVLHVPTGHEKAWVYQFDYDTTIRRLALGRFEDLLTACSLHPAMRVYLDNWKSVRNKPNENQGRELLELHTVGLAADYHERDVVDSARILTGWRVDVWNTWAAFYDRGSHYHQPVRVLGFRSENSSSDGRKVTRDYLHYLAHHPATARHIAGKLAVAFVSDSPPASLVKHLAHVYLQHGTQIRPVLRALVDSSEFRHSVGDKIRDPENDLVATYRLMGVRVARPPDQDRAAHQLIWQASTMGMMPMSWPAPNGQPIVGAAWASPSRVMGSMSTHYAMAGGWWPSRGIHYPEPTSWLPAATTRFDHLVDHLAQKILHRQASDTLQQACREAVAARAHDEVTKDHPVMQWLFPRLLTTLFDSPDFLRR